MGNHNQELGREGERLAQKFLAEQGMRIIETNFRFHRSGEIDIIARDGDSLVFCEVKTRENDLFGPPEAAITRGKQRTIRKIAEAYLAVHHIREHACRFDVVGVMIEQGRVSINHIPNAF